MEVLIWSFVGAVCGLFFHGLCQRIAFRICLRNCEREKRKPKITREVDANGRRTLTAKNNVPLDEINAAIKEFKPHVINVDNNPKEYTVALS